SSRVPAGDGGAAGDAGPAHPGGRGTAEDRSVWVARSWRRATGQRPGSPHRRRVHAPRFRRAPRYLRALTGIFPAKDVVVWTPAEIAEWSNVPTTFITTALREGRVLHAR